MEEINKKTFNSMIPKPELDIITAKKSHDHCLGISDSSFTVAFSR